MTAGAVFHDDDGRLTALRTRLSAFPPDVRLYKLACQWRRIAEEQAFVGPHRLDPAMRSARR